MNKEQDSFRVADSPGGILSSPCPKCKKQKCMQHAGWTSMQMPCQTFLDKELPHGIHVGGVFKCFNVTNGCCKIEGKSSKKKQKSLSNFTMYVYEL
eukprot:scaffold75237_cov72-Attheya_sp.AAC.3